MPSAEEIRAAQRATWAGLSAGWEKWDLVIMDQLGPVGAAMIERLDIAEDQQHLDIAAGTGEPGLSIARISPKGRVVLTDLAAEMLDVAARRSDAQGIANVETRVCSAGICQCRVRGRGVARRCRVGCRRRAGDVVARAVLGDDERARIARSRGASPGRRTGAGADSGDGHRERERV